MKADTGSSGEFGKDVVIIQLDLVVSGFGGFVLMRIRGSKTVFGRAFCSGLHLQFADGRHYQKIAQVAVSCSAEMCMRKSNDLAIVILVTGAVTVSFLIIFPANVMRLLVGVG